ncbi:MAG: hypothetical protein P8P88_08250 [Polaribacter sp.]|nr:hypothetical protein [Polaribacter sp.]
MSTNQQKNNNEEEVDLGSLFIIIGQGFSKFFNFFGNIFKGIFHFVILILIFLKENLLKIFIAAFIGAIVGVFLEVKTPSSYGSELLVEPNFKSVRQLYKNVNYYNDLVKQEKIAELQEIFNLDSVSAKSLQKFEIEPLEIDNDIIAAYDQLILSVDTLTIKSYEYMDFKKSFTPYDYKVHKIFVKSKKNDVFKKLGEIIISSIIDNKYFSRFKTLTNEDLNRKDSLYRQNLTQIDSLRKVYMQVMVEEAKKETGGTNIDLGGNKKSTKELELFETNRKINIDLKNIAIQKSNNYDVINVISNFQPIGYEIKGITKNYAFLLAILGSILMITYLLLLKLNNFLDNYKK